MRQWDRFLIRAEQVGHIQTVREIQLQRARRCQALAELAGVAPVPGAYYVLNLDRSTDRKIAFKNAARCCGMDVSRHRAIDAAAPDFDMEAHFDDFPTGSSRTIARRKAGSFCCFAGHRAIWRRALAEQAPVAAIYEDDAVPLVDPLRYLALHSPPEDWDIINVSERLEPLGACDTPYVPVRDALMSHFRFAGDLALRHPPGNDAYLVSPRGMTRLLEIFAEVGLPAATDYTIVRNSLVEDLETGFPDLDDHYNGRQIERQYVATGRPLKTYVASVALSELAAVKSVLSPIRRQNRRDADAADNQAEEKAG